MLAKIRDGATVGQDMGYIRWNADDTIFVCTKVGKKLYRCVANGYGNLYGDYGNGAVYVNKLKYLIPVETGE